MDISPVNPFIAPLTPKPATTQTSTEPSAQAVDVTPTLKATVTQTQDLTWLDQVLQDNWDFYKNNMMANQERVMSNNYGGHTISEGQSYAMLKAVNTGDKAVFDKVWNWTKTNMQVRQGDHLFAWEVAPKSDGSATPVTQNFATDADQDIAYALLEASEKWGDPKYKEEAMKIIPDLWDKAVVDMHDKKFIAPGDWEGFKWNQQTLDPSYMAPYVYRKFAEVDPSHDWNAVADNVYPTLEKATELSSVKLPPNWIGVPYDQDTVTWSDAQGQGSRDFGYDAFRVFWRMSEDASHGSEQAKAYLEKYTTLLTEWDKNHQLPEGYGPNGEPRGPSNSGFTLGAALAQAAVVRPDQVKQLYDQMLAPNYNPVSHTWFNYYNDYLQSVIWNSLNTIKLNANAGTVAGGAAPVPTMPPPVTPPPPTTPIEPTIPNNMGIATTTLKQAIQRNGTLVNADGTFGSPALQLAYQQNTNPLLRDLIGKLDYYTREKHMTFSLSDLDKAAGSKGFVTPEDIVGYANRMATQPPPVATQPPPAPPPVVTQPPPVAPPPVIQPPPVPPPVNTAPQPPVNQPPPVVTPQPVPPKQGVSLDSLKNALIAGNAYAMRDNRIDSAELQAARNRTNNELLKEVLGKMDYFLRRYNRSMSMDELQKLVNADGLINTTDVDGLPKTFNWF